MRRKMLILSSVITVVAFLSLSFVEEPKFKNLKVLDKNISKEDLEITMKQFKTALGVKCNFCHAQSKTQPDKLDFASDENKHKNIARGMMKMTMRINKKYFREHKNAITCYSCHNGNKEPKDPPVETLEE
ncbi:MAG: c-type cytochrome [Chitinophagaceae bacterium]|nr:c-type cytochrome [Chitinophagaceae bacterium]